MDSKPANLTNIDSGYPEPSLGTWTQVLAYDPRVPDVKIFGRSWTDKSNDEVPHSLWLRTSDISSLVFARPLILVNGCFDLLHTGHLSLLWKARQLVGPGGTVFVALDSDEMCRLKKGANRPVLTFQERASALRYLSISFIVEVSSDKQFIELFDNLKPDLRIKDSSKKYMKSRVSKDTTTVYVPKVGSISTSEIIRRVKG